MHTALKAQVQSGRLALDPPATPPEEAGAALLADSVDDLDEEERAELDAILDESLEDARAGRLVSNEDAFRNMERAERAALASR
jgi:predicted transcriptional regulator